MINPPSSVYEESFYDTEPVLDAILVGKRSRLEKATEALFVSASEESNPSSEVRFAWKKGKDAGIRADLSDSYPLQTAGYSPRAGHNKMFCTFHLGVLLNASGPIRLAYVQSDIRPGHLSLKSSTQSTRDEHSHSRHIAIDYYADQLGSYPERDIIVPEVRVSSVVEIYRTPYSASNSPTSTRTHHEACLGHGLSDVNFKRDVHPKPTPYLPNTSPKCAVCYQTWLGLHEHLFQREDSPSMQRVAEHGQDSPFLGGGT
ncbi:hypothetical protein ONZ45_g2439 [Pleurotus djamor]|nr:hypothetical protein ONZ45_g2439 [Pleurotus djamor]